MSKYRPRLVVWVLLLLLCAYLGTCHAEQPEQEVITGIDDGTALPLEQIQEEVRAEATSGSNAAVSEARAILYRIPRPKRTLAHLAKRKGFVGTSLNYGEKLFEVLFLNGPSRHDLSVFAPSPPTKLSTDLLRAVRLLKSAAIEQQDSDALWLLAEMNFHGNYTHPRNYTAAFEYYDQLAGINGNASAQYMLGFMYATGLGGAVERDQAKALLYHTFAADQGDIRSQMTVAYRHHAGIATPRNCEIAVKYYSRVAKKSLDFYKSGPPGGHVLFRNAYRIADEVGGYYGEGASVISSGVNARQGGVTSDAYADIADVLEYLDFQSRKGDLRATFNLAKLHYDGARGLQRDAVQAKQLFMQVARMFWNANGKEIPDVAPLVEKLAPRAAGFLGRMFLRGEGTKVSYEKARIWLKRGIDYGDVLSQYSMGVMYMNGLGVPRDAVRAASYLSTAADNDMAVAQTDLGVLFLDQGDVNGARAYFEHAVKSGHIEAYYYVGDMAHQGIGRDKSCAVAASYFKGASEKAEVLHSPWIEANQAYDLGNTHEALVQYMMAAEQGYENAQANVAWLLDQTGRVSSIRRLVSRAVPFVSHSPVSAADAALSLIYYTRSAKQNNIDSMVKAGDLHLLGLGVPANVSGVDPVSPTASSTGSTDKARPSEPGLLSPSPANAVSCYQAASQTMRSAQAMWNLGWTHELGLGVEKDYHLAKRYYDLALETNKEAYLPVKLALGKLRLKSWWNDVSHGGIRSMDPEDAGETGKGESTKQRWMGWREWVGRFLEADREMNGDHHEGFDDDEGGLLDDAGLAAGGLNQDEPPPRGRRGLRDADAGAGVVDGGVPPDWPEGYMGPDEGIVYDEDADDGLFESASVLLLAGLLGVLIWWRGRRNAQNAAAAQEVPPQVAVGPGGPPAAIAANAQQVQYSQAQGTATTSFAVAGEDARQSNSPASSSSQAAGTSGSHATAAEAPAAADPPVDRFVSWDTPGGVGH